MENKTKIENTKAKEKREKREEAREIKSEEKGTQGAQARARACVREEAAANPSEPNAKGAAALKDKFAMLAKRNGMLIDTIRLLADHVNDLNYDRIGANETAKSALAALDLALAKFDEALVAFDLAGPFTVMSLRVFRLVFNPKRPKHGEETNRDVKVLAEHLQNLDTKWRAARSTLKDVARNLDVARNKIKETRLQFHKTNPYIEWADEDERELGVPQ